MDRGTWKAAVHGVAEGRTRLSNFTFTFHFHALEKEMATHSSVLAWRISGMGEPGGLPSMGSHRVGHDWSDLAATAAICSCWPKCQFKILMNGEKTVVVLCLLTYLVIYLAYRSTTSTMAMLSHVWLFTSPWTVALQAPLSMGLFRPEY